MQKKNTGSNWYRSKHKEEKVRASKPRRAQAKEEG